jgi:uncharacterized Tic20 family protein
MSNGIRKEECIWAMLTHLIALIVIALRIPLVNIAAPLILWMIKRKEMPFVDVNGKESLNFQISISIYAFIASRLFFVYVGIYLLWVVALADIILVIMASIKTSNGESFKYPWTIRFIH